MYSIEPESLKKETRLYLTQNPDKLTEVIEIGVMVLTHVQTSSEVDFVKSEFEKLGLKMNTSLQVLQTTFEKILADAAKEQGKYFDPLVSGSYSQKMVEFLRDAVRNMKEDTDKKLTEVKAAYENFTQAVDFEKETSPLGKVKRLIVDTQKFIEEQFDETKSTSYAGRIKEQMKFFFTEDGILDKLIDAKFSVTLREQLLPLQEQLIQLREILSKAEGKAEIMEKTTGKGFIFEEELFVVLQEVARGNGDIVEQSGLTKETDSGSQKGDFIYSINGCKDKIIIEAKDKKVSLKESVDYMKLTLSARNAPFGILVSKQAEQLQKQIGSFGFYNNNIIITHAEFIDEAIRFGKYVMNLKAVEQSDSINVGMIKSHMRIIQDEFKSNVTIKSKLTAVDKTVTETNAWIRNQLQQSQDTIKNCLNEIENELSKAGTEQ